MAGGTRTTRGGSAAGAGPSATGTPPVGYNPVIDPATPALIPDGGTLSTIVGAVQPPTHPIVQIGLLPSDMDKVQAHTEYIQYFSVLLALLGRCDFDVTSIRAEYQQQLANACATVSTLAGNTPTPATIGAMTHQSKPKPPKLQLCDIFGPHVSVYLKSVQLYLNNFNITDQRELTMVYINHLTEASKEHLYNVHPLTDTAWYANSANIIGFLQGFTNESDKVTHALANIRTLQMKGYRLKAYYTNFCKHMSSAGWAPDSSETVRFFIDGLNADSLPGTGLKLALHELSDQPGVTVHQLFTAADRKLIMCHGINYSAKTDKIPKMPPPPRTGIPLQRPPSGAPPPPSLKANIQKGKKQQQVQQGSQAQPRVTFDLPECERCGKRHQGGSSNCWASRHKNGSIITTPKTGVPKRNLQKLSVPGESSGLSDSKQSKKQKGPNPSIRSIIVDPSSNDEDTTMSADISESGDLPSEMDCVMAIPDPPADLQQPIITPSEVPEIADHLLKNKDKFPLLKGVQDDAAARESVQTIVALMAKSAHVIADRKAKSADDEVTPSAQVTATSSAHDADMQDQPSNTKAVSTFQIPKKKQSGRGDKSQQSKVAKK